jgi:putative ABC transport system permease protein
MSAPDPWAGIKGIFRLPLGRRQVDADVNEELRFHLEERIDELVARGMTRPEAEREARARFGDVRRIGSEVKAIDGVTVRRRQRTEGWHDLLRDLRFGIRALRRRPGFTAAAVLTLALGIGANAAVFSAVDAVLLRPLQPRTLDRLVVVREDLPALNLFGYELSPAEAMDLAERNDLFEAVGGFRSTGLNLTGADGEPLRINAALTMGPWFDLIGARPGLGRFYRPEDSENGNHSVVVLSDELWRTRFGADPRVIGTSIELSGVRYEVIGVLAAGQRYPRDADVFSPFQYDARWRQPSRRGTLIMGVLARVREGIGAPALAEALSGEARAWVEKQGGTYEPERSQRLHGIPFERFYAGELHLVLLLLLGAVGLVLLLASANVGNLQLLRAAERARELAVRSALGAGRWPIARQLLAESAMIALAGGATGLLLGYLATVALQGPGSLTHPALGDVRLDMRVLLFTLGITTLAALLSGLVPALRASRADPQALLRASSGRGATGRYRLLHASVVTQLALSLMLLLGAGMLLQSLGRLLAASPGFEAERVTAMRLTLTNTGYGSEEKRIGFFDQLLGRVSAIPGVEAAGLTAMAPFSGNTSSSPFRIVDKPIGPGDPQPHANMWNIHGDYFRAMGIPLEAGRVFGAEDGFRVPRKLSVIVDERLAKEYFPGENPIGRVINQGPDGVIVGVVGTVKHNALTEADKAAVYWAYPQMAFPLAMTLVVRSTVPTEALAGRVRDVVRNLDPTVPVSNVRPVSEMVDRSLGPRKLAMAVLMGFAGLAVVLALVGVYAVLSYTTKQRRRELGIRHALGAAPRSLVGLVLRRELVHTALGLALGVAAFLAVGRLLGAMMYGVGPRDPATILGGVALLGVGAGIAAFLPARRAARADPLETLREE